MEITTEAYSVKFAPEETAVYFQGSLRLSGMDDYTPIVELMNEVAASHPAAIVLDLTHLEFLNSSGISMLSKFVINVRKENKTQMVVRGSNSIPWQGKSLKNLQRLMPTLTLEMN